MTRIARAARAVLAACLVGGLFSVVTLAVTAVDVVTASKAEAVIATGGSGRFRETIQWFTWGANNADIPNAGLTRTEVYDVSGRNLALTCSLSNITGTQATGAKLKAYRPGTWQGDGLDDLYNIGGTGANNQMIVGLTNRNIGQTVNFQFACTATLDGAPYALDGLVVADAEQSAGVEYVEATPVPASATWRILDRTRNCTGQNTNAVRDAANKLRFVNTGECGTGPMAVGYMEGATSANVSMRGGGASALSLGVIVLPIDYGDAPASYGQAASTLQYTFSGGNPSVGTTNISADSFPLASVAQPANRIGTSVDPNDNFTGSVAADSDDLEGTPAFGGPDDEDAVNLPSQVRVTPGEPFTIPNIGCTGLGPTAGWIDFNTNGTFDPGEKSNQSNCAGGQVSLTWQVPTATLPNGGAPTTYLRLRTAGPGEALNPTGLTNVGEVEDHRIAQLVAAPRLRVAKQVAGRVAGNDQFQVTATGPEASGITVTTTGAQTSATSPSDLVQTGSTYTITDTMAVGNTNPLSDYTPTISCRDTVSDSALATTAGAAGTWTISNLQNGQNVVCTVTNTPRPPDLNVTKTAGTTAGPDAQGNYTVTYRATVANAGVLPSSYGPLIDTPGFPANLTVDGISWTTSGAGAPPGGTSNGSGPFTIAPGDTAIARNTTHTYDITLRYHFDSRTAVAGCSPAGAGNGLYNRVAIAAGEETGPAADNAACVAPPAPPIGSLSLDKTSAAPVDLDANGVDAGDRIDYSFAVANTGNVTASSVGIADPLLAGVSCQATSLAPGASTTCTGSYLLTQADVDAGSRANTARATATDPQGNPIASAPDSTTQTWTAPASLAFDKSAGNPVDTNGNARIDARDRITYSFTVRNSGNVTMTNIAVTDPLIPDVNCTPTTLAPGAAATCTAAAYVITQADVDAGSVNNTASATGTRPGGGNVPSNTDSTTTSLIKAPELTIDKTAAAPVDVNGSGITDAGDTIRYSFSVRNTGNVTVNAVNINDPDLTGITITCAPTSLAPNAVATCTTSAPYVVTAADEANAAAANSATARGTAAGGGAVESQPDTTTTPVATPAPGLSIDKVAAAPVDANSSGITDAGDTISYSFTVRNSGNVPIRSIAVDDAELAAVGITISCGTGALAPGETRDCATSAPYVVTVGDQSDGQATNSATATGVDPDNDAVRSGADTTSTPVLTPRPEISLAKVAGTVEDTNQDGLVDRDDRIPYTFTITNTGNVPLTAIDLSDPKLATQGITVSCPSPVPAGASRTCTTSGTYAVTAADDSAGEIVNEATASGAPPTGPRVSSSDEVRVQTVRAAPEVEVAKTADAPVDANQSGNVDAGDRVGYTFRVTNTGNVAVRTVAIDDDKLAAAGVNITCAPEGPLAPGATKSCTTDTPYTITAPDVQSGAVTNTATATGIDPYDASVTSPEDTATVPTTAPDPRLIVEKSAGAPVDVNDSDITDAGDRITYSFTVQNLGNVPLNGLDINDAMLAGQGITVTCAPTALPVNGSATCTSSGPYTISTGDQAAGAVANSATAEAVDPDGDAVVSLADSTSTPTVVPRPTLQVAKNAASPVDVNGSGITDAGDTIRYSFTVTNTGNVPVSAIEVRDPKLAAAGITTSCTPGTLAPEGVATCSSSASYTITSADVAAGAADNTARAAGTDPDQGEVVSPPSTVSVPTTQPAPALALDKSAGTPVDANNSGITDTGDSITFTFTLTNTGNVPIGDIAVNDPKLAGLTVACDDASLDPGDSTTCRTTTPYTVTSADVTAGSVANSATASGTDPDAGPVRSAADTTSTPTIRPAPSLTVEKSAGAPVDVNGSGITDAGDTITYSFTVTNAGNVPIDDIAIDDPKLAGVGVSCTPTSLAPGESAACSTDAPYVVISADVSSGAVANSATATGADRDGATVRSGVDSTSTPTTTPRPQLQIQKRASAPVDVNGSGITDAGDTIAYSFTVTNPGNVPVEDIAVEDPMLAGIDIACTPTSLDPGDSAECAAEAPYVVTAVDVTAGEVSNSASATGTDPDGLQIPPSNQATTSTPTTAPRPSLRIDKTAAAPVDVNGSGITDAGDTIAYSFTLTNTGNVPVVDVSVVDQVLDGQDITITCDPSSLAPGTEATCTTSAPYRVSEGDEVRRSAVNSATAVGSDPDGANVTSAPDTTTTPVTAPRPALSISKSASAPTDVNGSGLTDAGDTIVYSFTVTNVGNVPISQVAVTDPKLTGSGVQITCPTGSLAPGATRTCTTSRPYVITTSDVGNGAVVNVARAVGADPDGGAVTGPPASTSTATTQPRPGLKVEKTAATPVDVNDSGITDAGDTIAYSFTVTNTGNVPVDLLRVNDPVLTGAGVRITCAQTSLAPGATAVCTPNRAYVVTAADEAAGTVANTATATAEDPDGGPVGSDPDTTSTPVTAPQPTLDLEKIASDVTDADGNGTDVGDTISYTFVVANTGNVPINLVRIFDRMFPSAPGNFVTNCNPALRLAAGQTAACATLTHQITQAEIDAGRVVNTANAQGTDPDGQTIQSPPDDATVTLDQRPALALRKSATAPVDVNSSGITDAGDTIAYTFELTNTGNVTITGASVSDPKLAAVTPPIPITCPGGDILPGQSVTCAADRPYVVTGADVAAGSAVNTATATGAGPAGPVESAPSTTSTPTTIPDPSLDLDKSAGVPVDVNGSGLTDGGDTITYTFIVTNPGNVPIRNVVVTDAKLQNAGITITCPPVAPFTTVTCSTSGSYVVTETDQTSGSVANTASASGTDPDGAAVTSPPDSTSTPVRVPQPRLEILKTAGTPVDANGSGITDAGDTVAYTFRVTNTGNVPVTSVRVEDAKLAAAGITIACTPAALAAGAVAVCTASRPYVVTGQDVTTGSVVNVATVTGTDPDGAPTPPSNPSSTSTTVTAPAPALAVKKSAGVPVDVNGSGITDAGDTVAYTFTVTNTGNVPVTDVGISDAMLAEAGIGITCDPESLGVGEEAVCAADAPYVVIEADEAAGFVVNTANATATDPDDGAVTSPPDDTSTAVTVPAPALQVQKSAGAPVDVNDSGITDAGDTIPFTFTVTNRGNVPVTDVAVVDEMLADAGIAITCDPESLGVGEEAVCAADAPYVVTEADEAAGFVANEATATATDPDGGAVTSPLDDTATPIATPKTGLILEKSVADVEDVNESGLTDAGDRITYEFEVRNTGNVPLRSIAIDDPMLVGLEITCPAGPLAPGATVTCTMPAPYVVTAADVNATAVANTATATGIDPDDAAVQSPNSSTSTTTTRPQPGLSLVKEAAAPVDVNGSGITDAGDTIDYSFTVTNAGNVPVSVIAIDDALIASVDITITCPPGRLAPGESVACATDAPYVVTEADEQAGAVTNTATATGVNPDGGPVVSSPATDSTSTTVPAASITLRKVAGTPVDADGDGRIDAGDSITYTFVVTNAGNVPVSDVTVTDPKVAEVTCPDGDLPVGESVTCTAAAYTITQTDVDAGVVSNTATAGALDPDGDPVAEVTDTVTTDTTALLALQIDKQAADPVDVDDNGRIDSGDIIAYSFTVTNIGTITVTEVAVDDPMLAGLEIVCAPDVLAPDQAATCSVAPYVLTQADIDAGAVNNSATATGVGADGTPVEGETVESEADGTSTPLGGEAALSLDKRAHLVDRDSDGRADAGERIDYTFLVKNTGNLSLREIRIVDEMLTSAGVQVTCPLRVLAPGESTTCSATYRVVAGDLGDVLRNVATAAGVLAGCSGSDADCAVASADAAVSMATSEPPTDPTTDNGGNPDEDPAGDDGYGFGLPDTGGASLLLLLIGAVLVAIGLVLVAGRRRSRAIPGRKTTP